MFQVTAFRPSMGTTCGLALGRLTAGGAGQGRWRASRKAAYCSRLSGMKGLWLAAVFLVKLLWSVSGVLMDSSAPMSQAAQPARGLPPVTPPSGRFIAQLFLVPGLIVLVAVLLLMAFTYTLSSGNTPERYLAQ